MAASFTTCTKEEQCTVTQFLQSEVLKLKAYLHIMVKVFCYNECHCYVTKWPAVIKAENNHGTIPHQ
jgi:hypothetical protein